MYQPSTTVYRPSTDPTRLSASVTLTIKARHLDCGASSGYVTLTSTAVSGRPSISTETVTVLVGLRQL